MVTGSIATASYPKDCKVFAAIIERGTADYAGVSDLMLQVSIMAA